MPQHSVQVISGVTTVISYIDDVNGRPGTLFDQKSGSSVPGWSGRLAKVSHVKTADEATGQVTAVHK